jgi:hypothetical protein
VGTACIDAAEMGRSAPAMVVVRLSRVLVDTL